LNMEPKNHPFSKGNSSSTQHFTTRSKHIEDPDANELAGPVGCGANVGVLAETKGVQHLK